MRKPDRQAAAAAIDAFLRALGREPQDDPNLVGTAARVADMFSQDLCAGYGIDATALLARETFPVETTSGSAGVVVLRDLAVTTTCPHHLMPATGLATVAFAPQSRLVGIGTVGHALDALSRRLTLQEEIGENMARALFDALAPVWAGCRLVLTHTCMTARGQRRHGARVETISIVPAGDRPVAYYLLSGSTSGPAPGSASGSAPAQPAHSHDPGSS
ncbi:GTP cyclohydrolase I [Pendulispora albinea]|uniref:GTP cyclohydrolase I n=1 Tax=Pendulispora albinea TaxID=2741071 RepID=A0ABZ2LXP9_9BACT